jgi:ribonucleoside-diphosphate reductase alpha chain
VKEVMAFDDAHLQEVVAKSPYYKATSNDVDWLSKVRMQGEVQKWVDHSISVTINLPNNATEELVDQLYVTAWQSGCKGVTVYRDGSRSGVLLTMEEADKDKGSEDGDPQRYKRPQILDAEIIRFSNNEEKWIAFIGLKDNRPYEIFTGIVDDEMFPIPKSITKGKIIKNRDENGKSRYDFQYVDKYGYTNTLGGLSHMFNKEYWNYAKLFSSVLRHGMPIADVVNLISSLVLDSDTINTWKNGVERALRKYIPNDTRAKKGKVCGECGSATLIYQEGCLKCTSCGSSKCG